jgi:hypothetical protein
MGARDPFQIPGTYVCIYIHRPAPRVWWLNLYNYVHMHSMADNADHNLNVSLIWHGLHKTREKLFM